MVNVIFSTSSRAGQTLQKLNIEPKKGMEGKTVAEYVASEKLQPSDINEEKLANVLDEVAFSAEDLKKDLTRQLEISKTTGDYSELYRIGKLYKQQRQSQKLYLVLQR